MAVLLICHAYIDRGFTTMDVGGGSPRIEIFHASLAYPIKTGVVFGLDRCLTSISMYCNCYSHMVELRGNTTVKGKVDEH